MKHNTHTLMQTQPFEQPDEHLATLVDSDGMQEKHNHRSEDKGDRTLAPTQTPKKRPVKSAARKALEASFSQFDELLTSGALEKASKRADVLMAKAGVIRELLALEAADRDTEAQDTIERLEQQHADDARRIGDLEAENRTLRNRPVEVKTTLDPEHAAVREKNETLNTLVKFVTGTLSDIERSQMAIHSIQTLTPDAARLFCQFTGVDYPSYFQMLHRTDAELHDVIAKARCEGPAVVFARALLAMREAAVVKSVTTPSDQFVDTRSGEEKLAAAKAMVRGTRRQFTNSDAIIF